MALYREPPDPAAFDEAYFKAHLPLVQKVPGLEKTVVTRFTRSLGGDAFYMMAEMYFADEDALRRGMKSEEMRAAGDNLNSFAEGLATMLFGDEIGS
ncbi:MAG TPA: EthD family reductase [Anaerolineales bacterium]|nr:EthD family reductase [Anaerolineales bacterium]